MAIALIAPATLLSGGVWVFGPLTIGPAPCSTQLAANPEPWVRVRAKARTASANATRRARLTGEYLRLREPADNLKL
jgi:hypothetical protein